MSVAVDDRVALRVGAVALTMLLVAVVFVVVVWDHIEIGRRVRFAVYFEHVGALHAGAPVMVAGREIGTVESISLLSPSAPGPEGRGVVARVAIDAAYQRRIPIDAAFFVSSRGLLSERLLEIGPGPSAQGSGALARPIQDGDRVIGIDPPSMDQTLQVTWMRLEIAKAFLADVRPAWDGLRAELRTLQATLDGGGVPLAVGPLVDQSGAMIDELRRTFAYAEAAQAGRSFDDAQHGVTAFGEHLDARLGDLRPRWAALRAGAEALLAQLDREVPDVVARARTALAAIDAAVAKIEPLRAGIEALVALAPKGTLLKVLMDPEFPEDSRALGKILKREPWKLLGHTDDVADP